jgi:N-acyl-D-amino-acid deacylase
MRLGRSLLSDRQPGKVRYYDYEGAPPAESVFPDASGRVPWPYGGFHLEAMDAHGGWIASAVDLAHFVSALDGSHPSPILEPETLDAMLSRPAAPLWEGRSDYYGLGWRVRPARDSANWWHTGSLPGTSAVLYRTSGGLAWVALFNTRPNAPGDAFLVELIGAMGRAAIADKLRWGSLALLAVLGSVATLVIVRVRKRKMKA